MIRSAVSQRAVSRPEDVITAFQLSSPKLKYLKNARSARFETSPAARAIFWARVRVPRGSRSGTGALAGRPQRPASVMPTAQSTTVWNIISRMNHGLAHP